jgi:Uma2 family endonuclease
MSVLNPPASPANPVTPPRAPHGIEPGQLLVLHHVSYESYVAMADAIMDRPSVRFTFDRGTLEIMTTSNRHEWYKARLGRVLEVACEVVGRPWVCGGSQTLRGVELQRGFEPDQCYWIANESRVREPFFLWDPALYPPPDLVIEIEITRSAVAKLDLFAAYRIPEVWRFDETTLRVYLLQGNGTYQESSASPNLPGLSVPGLLPFIAPDPSLDSLTWTRELRAWVETQRSSS